jgi:hypothetical protein
VQQFGAAGQALVAQALDAFVNGVGDAVLVGSVVLLVAAVAVFVLAPGRVTRGEPAESAELAASH